MKVIEVENIRERYPELRDTGWFIALQNSIKDSLERYPGIDMEERDLIFERENKCQINYRINGKTVRSIIFNREQDYTMFILRWV